MEKVLLLSIVITVFFGIMKFVEMKYLENKLKPLRDMIRDLVMVFGASFVCAFGLINYQHKFDDFWSVITNQNVLPETTTQVFTGNPDF
jgi:hypothetical protein